MAKQLTKGGIKFNKIVNLIEIMHLGMNGIVSNEKMNN